MGWTTVGEYFAADPLRLLTLLGGSGGVLYWADRIRNRTRVRVRLLREKFIDGPDAIVDLEITNVGKDPTSLEPSFVVTGFTPKGKTRTFTFEVQSEDRHLPPHVQKRIVARTAHDSVLVFLWFKTYRVALTRGSTAKLRIEMFNGERLSWLRFRLGLMRFRLFGRVAPIRPEDRVLE